MKSLFRPHCICYYIPPPSSVSDSLIVIDISLILPHIHFVREVLEDTLLKKKKLRRSQLGMAYHVADLAGSDLVQRVNTTSGAALRLVE